MIYDSQKGFVASLTTALASAMEASNFNQS